MQVEGKKKGASGHRRNPVHLHKGIFVSPGAFFFFSPLVFCPFWEENFLVGPKRKNPSPTISFPSLPPNQTPSKKYSLLVFFFFFSIFPKIHSTKHTIKLDKTKNLERERERALLGLKIGNC